MAGFRNASFEHARWNGGLSCRDAIRRAESVTRNVAQMNDWTPGRRKKELADQHEAAGQVYGWLAWQEAIAPHKTVAAYLAARERELKKGK